MLPCLKPRPSSSGMENAIPTELNASLQPPETSTLELNSLKVSNYDSRSVGLTETVVHQPLSESKSSVIAPMSPTTRSPPISPHFSKPDKDEAVKTPVRNGGYHKHILDYPYSSSSVDSSVANDVTLTPPAAPLQSLVVAAKRHSSEIREANNSKRRRRRRQHYTMDTELSSILVRATSNSKSAISSLCDEGDDFSWNDSKVVATTESSPVDKLPFLLSEGQIMSPEEKTKKYWEWCYGAGEPRDASVTFGSFSAKRMPPSKGW